MSRSSRPTSLRSPPIFPMPPSPSSPLHLLPRAPPMTKPPDARPRHSSCRWRVLGTPRTPTMLTSSPHSPAAMPPSTCRAARYVLAESVPDEFPSVRTASRCGTGSCAASKQPTKPTNHPPGIPPAVLPAPHPLPRMQRARHHWHRVSQPHDWP